MVILLASASASSVASNTNDLGVVLRLAGVTAVTPFSQAVPIIIVSPWLNHILRRRMSPWLQI